MGTQQRSAALLLCATLFVLCVGRPSVAQQKKRDVQSAQPEATVTHLDGKYTIFGKVVDGFETIELIEKAARNGESPVQRIELIEAAIKQ